MVQAGVASGILLRDPSQFDNNPEMDEDLVLNHSSAVGENPLESPIATIDGAIHYANDLSRYLQALKITELHTPSGKELPVSEIVNRTSNLRIALI
ncbi:uncharacterized protein H6S33_003746, partial [Morchella sextelata]|uniref:uncharacterized protein n=1 Tax=Morchella sextelata TaxID=1174677 RepID=UPI001D047AE8